MFADIFEHNANLTAIGPYISCEFNKHIQSFMIALDRRSVNLLEKTWLCPYVYENRMAWIKDTEVVICLPPLIPNLISKFLIKLLS